jgi:hypothetical protein
MDMDHAIYLALIPFYDPRDFNTFLNEEHALLLLSNSC